MSSAIEKLINKLKNYPDVKYTYADNLITVEPKDENGFTVSLGIGHREYIVSSDFWHEHFDKDEEEKALNCFAFMLSDSCRLKIEYKGEKPETWTIESFEDNKWVGDSATGLFNFQVWKPTRIQYLQNDIIKTRGK